MSPSIGILIIEFTRFVFGLAEKLINRELEPETAKEELSQEFDRVAAILTKKDSEVA